MHYNALYFLLEDRHSSKTYTNKQTNTYIVYLKNNKKRFNLLKKKHIGTSFQNLLALNGKDQEFSPSPIKIDFKIGIRWF